ncbi:phosphotransferase family protein [Occultella aeris]|uniref:Phosphotransferase enzyme family protein n=1 Tax=Occultella aeris TaxID=2761496 RepID=A0A7M4DLC0_9MICO|nr:phosphotransferase [Occultella aeris]VZO38054.1 Phosphotransferase enzyme family protein [Occultella aeris]
MATPAGSDGRVWVAALAGSDVLTSPAPDGSPSLPSVQGRWLSASELRAATGIPAALPIAPARLVGEHAVVHVLDVTEPISWPAEHRVAFSGIDRLAVPAEVRAAVELGVAERRAAVPTPALRPDWYRAGWLDEATAWVDRQVSALGLRREGPGEPIKVWCLSAVVRFDCRGDGGANRPLYLKAACDWFRAEPAITVAIGALAPAHVPTVRAADAARGWLLLDPLPGAGTDAPVEPDTAGLALPTARAMADLQLRSLEHVEALKRAGCPDRGTEPTLAAFADVLAGSVELPLLSAAERAGLSQLGRRVERHLRDLASCGIPDTLTHGDLHLGNVAADADRLVIYDWTDAAIAHPFLDAALLARSHREEDPAAGDAVLAEFAAPWRAHSPGADVDRALALAPVANLVHQCNSYEGIARSLEPDARWELAGVVAANLRQLLEQLT